MKSLLYLTNIAGDTREAGVVSCLTGANLVSARASAPDPTKHAALVVVLEDRHKITPSIADTIRRVRNTGIACYVTWNAMYTFNRITDIYDTRLEISESDEFNVEYFVIRWGLSQGHTQPAPPPPAQAPSQKMSVPLPACPPACAPTGLSAIQEPTVRVLTDRVETTCM